MKVMHARKYALTLAAFLLACSTMVKGQQVRLDTSVRTGRLSNGFTYFIRHNSEPKQRVLFYLLNKIGSMQEDDNQRGLAHFMEHMSFNGTKHYPKNQLIEYLQKAGVRFGADLNAYTGFNETVYQLPLPSDDTSIVRNGLQIMRDWAAEASLETEEINKERGVVLEEKRLRNGAGQRLQEKAFPMQVNNSRYASRLPIGTEQVLNGFTPAAVKSFYKDWYRPGEQALVVVGDIDVNAMEAQVRKLFGDLRNPVKVRPVIKYSIPLTGKNQFLAATDPELTNVEMSLLIKQREAPLKMKTDFRVHIMRNLLNQVLGNRLEELGVRADPPFIQAQASISRFMGGLDAFSVSIIPKPGKIQAAFDTVWTEVVRLQRLGVSNTELNRAKLAYLNGMENTYKEKSKITSEAYVQDYLNYFLNGVAAPGIDVEYAIAKEYIAGITLEDVNTLARTMIKETDRDVMIFAPEKNKAELPTQAQMNGWIASIGARKLTPWKDAVSDSSLMPVLPTPGNVVSRERVDSIGATRYTLSNGVKVWVKPTTFKNEEVLFGAFSEGGTSIYPDSLFLQAGTASWLIPANGVGDFGPVELGKLLTGKSVQVQPFIGEMHEGVNGGAVTKDLETALQLTHLYFTKPRYDAVVIANNIKGNRAALLNRDNNPEQVFNDTVNLVTSGFHYRRQPYTVDKLDSIRPEKAFDIYKERFANASDFTFIFVGSIDTTTFLPLIQRYLGSLPSSGQKETWKDAGIYVPKGQISKTVYKGKDNKAVVKLYYSGEYSFNSANNTQLSALGSVLQYRMTERIRELEGGAYTPRAGVSYGKLPQSRYLVSIEFTCAPQNAEKLISAARDEISKLKNGPASADDIAKFKAEQTRMRELQLQNNGFWQGWLSYALQNDENPSGVFYLQDRLKAVTGESVQRAAKEFINDANFIRLVMMPEK